MSKVKITGHASGSGTITLTGPNTSSDRTITLPDSTGTVALGVGISDSADATAITIDSSENVGIGVTPESWISTYSTLQMGDSLALSARTTEDTVNLSNNAYADSVDSRWEYIGANGSSEAALLVLDNGGKFVFRTAPAGAADAEITWTTAMSIDNSGRVTMPSQPVASFGWSGDISANNVITADLIRVNIGSHLNSSGRFTAPVAGTYWYGYFGMSQNNNNNFKVELLKNGSLNGNDTRAYTHDVAYSQNSLYGFITLSANDYLEFKVQLTTLHSNYGQISIKLVA